MLYFSRPPALIPLGILCLSAFSAMADDDLPITVTNNDADSVYVSLYDMNTQPRSKLLSHQKINGFASIPLRVSADASGYGHVYWTAVAAGSFQHKCGRKDRPGLSNDASVHVYARSDCPGK